MRLEYELYALKNGARILLIPAKTTNSVNIHALLNSGAALESKETQGLTHLVEHMALTCTESWPTKEILNTETEYVGGGLNGSTGKETLEYYITLPYTKVEFGVKVIYEVLYKSLITEKNLKTERTVIIDEINKSIDDPMHLDGDFIYNKLYGNDNGYSYDTAGTKETVRSFTLDQVKEHYKFAHSSQKLLFAISGNFDTKEVKEIIEKTIGSVNHKADTLNYYAPSAGKNLVETEFNSKTEQIFADVMFEFKGLKDLPYRETLIGDLTRVLLAGPMSSRLKKRLREEEGLLYGIGMGSSVYHKFGSISISYEIDPVNYEKCFTILNEELKKVAEKGVTEKEIEHYREYMINRWLLKYDDPKSYSRLIKYPIFLGLEVKHLDEMIADLKSITKKEIDAFIKENLDLNKANYFAFGNITDQTKEFMKKNAIQ